PGAIEAPPPICKGGDPAAITNKTGGTGDGVITYRWESSVSPFNSWSSVNGVNSASYDVPAGLTATTQYRRITIATLNGQPCESPPTQGIEVSISPDNTLSNATPQTLCVNTTLPTITHTTTGATGIVPESASVDYNLPNGVTASWSAGVLTISGTPIEKG